MKRTLGLLLASAIFFISSCNGVDQCYTKFTIDFPEEPVTILTNEQSGKQLMNYFNIIQTGERQYRMYFSAVEHGDKILDFNNNLYIATSEDLVHWNLENPKGGSNMLMKNLVEQSVCYIEGDEYPYRLVGNIWEDEKYKLCMWLSKDGINFTDRTVVLEDMMHDSQCVLIPEDGYFKLYLRKSIKLGPGNYNRRIATCCLDMSGKPLTEIELVAGERLYNSAASKIDERFDLLIPTYFNNEPGLDDSCHFNAYIVDGIYSNEIECPLNKWVAEDEKWVLAAPGILHLDGKTYIAYYARNTSHDEGRIDRSDYKLIEITVSSHPYWKDK